MRFCTERLWVCLIWTNPLAKFIASINYNKGNYQFYYRSARALSAFYVRDIIPL